MIKKTIKNYIKESGELHTFLISNKSFIESVHKAIIVINDCFQSGHKILIAGNGGSAADAQHFAAEIVGRYKRHRRAYPAIALTTDTSIMTAWSNDYNFNSLFARKVEALGNPGDVFMGISTSGNSKNIIEGAKKAKQIGLKNVSLLGRDGGELKSLSDLAIVVPSSNTPRIQEVHTMIIHIISEEVEKNFHDQ